MPGCSARTRIAARTPSSRNVGGIRTSSTATSGAQLADLGEQGFRVAVGADGLEAGLVEQPDETLAQQHGVVGDDDAEAGGIARGTPPA